MLRYRPREPRKTFSGREGPKGMERGGEGRRRKGEVGKEPSPRIPARSTPMLMGIIVCPSILFQCCLK